jgi:LysM repeat protein
MKNLTLTSTLVALLSLPVFGQSASSINSSITAKEQEITRLEKEIAALRTKLTTPAPSVKATGDYVIQTGDTVSSIARKHQMTASQLIALNNLSDPSKIQIGHTLKVGKEVSAPAPTPAKVTKKTTTAASTSKTSDYLIQKGDTFYSIARKHKMTVTKLRALNPDIKTHLITIGLTLKVSGTPASSTQVAQTKKVEKKATDFRAATNSGDSKPAMISTKKKTLPAEEKVASAPRVTKKTPPTPPTPEYTKKETVAAVAPPIPPKMDEPEPEHKKATSVASIILTDEMTFDAFAKKHEVSTDQLNSLNGWTLPKATVLARGSEIYIPK